MNNIKKIVLFKNKKSEEGASWAIIRDDGYEIVSLKEGRNICLRYAAMNGITTGKMVEEKLFDKVIFYSPDFESLFRNHIVNDCFNNLDDEDYPLIVEEEKPNQFAMVGNTYMPVEENVGAGSSDSLETSDSQLFSKAKDDLNNMPIVEEEKPKQFVLIGNPYVSDDADDGIIESKEIGEEPTGKGEEAGEEPTGKGEKPGEEPTVKGEEAEESLDEGDIGIIDRIKNFGNGVLNQLKKYAFFETIVGMVVVGIVTIFGVKYSLNRDKDDIYVNHHSNTEEFADDEDLYTSPLAKFINKIFPTNEYNESEEIQYIPYTSESDNNSDFSEFSTDNSGEVDLVEYTDDTDFVETTDDTDFVETTDDTDFVETTDDTDFVETTDDTDFVETTDDTDFVEYIDDTDFYDITIDSNSEDAVLVNDEKLFDEIEYDNGYNSDYTSNITFDPSGDQTDLTLPDPNASSAYSAFIDSYFRILESSGDVSESGKQYVKTA